jgi:hypothetical protein
MQKTIIGKFPSKSSAAATTPASSRTRPKQSIPAGKPLCNPTSGGDAGGGPSTHQQNQSGTGRGNSFPVERRSVLPPYRPHDQQRQPLFDFPPTISPAFAVPGRPGGRRLHPRSEGASGVGSGSSTGGTSGVGISRFFGHGCSTPISETTPLSVRGLPGLRGENISSSIGSQNLGSTTTYQRRPGGFRPTDAQALIPISERINPTAPLATFGGGTPHSGCSDLSAPRRFSRVPTSKNAIHLLRSLSCNPPSRSGGLDNGRSSPPGKKSGAVAGETSVVQDLRAARLTPLSPEEQARTLLQLLFAAPPSDAAMDTAGPSGPQRSRDEPVAFLHVECPNF